MWHTFIRWCAFLHVVLKSACYYQLNRKLTLQNTERGIKNGQSRETGRIGYTRRRKTKQNTTQYVLDTTIRNICQSMMSVCWTG